MWEVVEKATGARMSRSPDSPPPGKPPELTGTTLFPTGEKAWAWMNAQGLGATHAVKEAQVYGKA